MNHTEGHKRSHVQNFGCQTCGKIFLSEDEMLKHMNDNHKSETLDATFFNPSFADSERNSIEGEVGDL